MARVTHHFQEVVYKATKKGICPVCGKNASRTSGKRFMQTINPFNRNDQGEIKSYQEIMQELRAKAKPWMNEPVYHVKCEP